MCFQVPPLPSCTVEVRGLLWHPEELWRSVLCVVAAGRPVVAGYTSAACLLGIGCMGTQPSHIDLEVIWHLGTQLVLVGVSEPRQVGKSLQDSVPPLPSMGTMGAWTWWRHRGQKAYGLSGQPLSPTSP